MAMTSVAKEAIWLRRLVGEIKVNAPRPMQVMVDLTKIGCKKWKSFALK
jgi:hypothetical protein